ncbi:MAG TPA: DUF4199 domain-containing protein [Mucilaginibacter sp.]
MKPPVKYGLITGCIVGLFTMTFFSIFDWINTKLGWGMRPSSIRGITGLLTILIQAIGIYMGIKAAKTNQGNSLNYWQGVKTGVTIAVITAIITSACSFLYCTVLNPSYTDYMVQAAEREMIEAGETKGQMAAHLAEVRKSFRAPAQVMMAFVGQLVMGSAISFILSPFIQNKKKNV